MKDYRKICWGILMVVAATALSLQSCGQDEPEYQGEWPWDGPISQDMLENPSYWVYDHKLYICFEDKNGLNIADTIKEEYYHRYDDIRYSISSDLFSLVTEGNGFNTNGTIFGEGLHVLTLDDKCSYVDFTWRTTLFEVSKVMTRKLTCLSIFGNNDEHILVAKYIAQPKIELVSVPMKLTNFTLDGKEYEIKDDNRVTVTLPLKKD